MLAFSNADFYTGDTVVTDKILLVNDDRIFGFVSSDELPAGCEVVNLGGLSVAPGFFDVQVNGGGGVLFNDDATLEGLRAISSAHEQFGTMYMLPTYITGSLDGMRQAAEAVQCARKAGLSSIVGVHFEGPWIAHEKAGVHDKTYIRPPNSQDMAVILACKDVPVLVTLAPELCDPSVVATLVAANIRVSAGHTNATYEELRNAAAVGLKGVTHIHNAMTPLGSREPGAVGGGLALNGLYAGIIVDGFHVHFETVKLTFRMAAREHLYLVTDAMPPVGSDRTRFSIGDLEIISTDGRCVTKEGVLGGSALDMATAVRNCIQKVGLPKDEAFRMASLYPAKFLGLERQIGFIRKGYPANLVICDNEIHVHGIVRDGQYRQLV